VTELARRVDAKMREAAAATGVTTPLKVAILAAMNLADELHEERQARREDQRQLAARAGQIVRRLSEEVGDEPAEGL